MNVLLEKMVEMIKSNLRNPKMYLVLLIVVVALLVLFPYIDANYFYYNRVQKRIEILKEVMQIDKNKASGNAILEAEYEDILDEMNRREEGSLSNIFIIRCDTKTKTMKFITGAIVIWLLGVLCLFVVEKWYYKLFGLGMFAVLGALFGGIATVIPVIVNPICNYILIPVLQVVFLGIILSGMDKK